MFLRFFKILTYFDKVLETAIDKLHEKKFGIQKYTSWRRIVRAIEYSATQFKIAKLDEN